MKMVIFAGGNVRKGRFLQAALENADKAIAADSGAESALAFDIVPDVTVGDFDSLSKETTDILKQKGSELLHYPAKKNETDTELAVEYALDQGATHISILGGMEGSRLDHVLAIALMQVHSDIQLEFINGPQKSWLAMGPKRQEILGKENDLLSLIPVSEKVEDIRTQGLQYRLDGQNLFFGKSRGISNVFEKKHAVVCFDRGKLLFVHTSIEDLQR